MRGVGSRLDGPLAGLRVLVPGTSGGALAAALRSRGAEPVVVPTISIRAIASERLDRALATANERDWIVVTSANGVAAAFDRLRALDLPKPTAPRWAAVGPKTAAALEGEGIRVDHVPHAGLGAAIPDGMGGLKGADVLLLRARGAGEKLPRILRRRGADVEDVDAYETVEGPEESREPLRRALESGIDGAIFNSGSTARGYDSLTGGAEALDDAGVVCIGPSTAAAAREAGFSPAAVASERTPGGLAAALERAVREEAEAAGPRSRP
ncbi:MAG: uroporphyrinogen-III synthase [Gemmatimonadota bacterium]|nr:uroporphyrinogen-III synthase [Gemmatimonadota bacterium]